jgi:iron(III) transport system substrate-binding protein
MSNDEHLSVLVRKDRLDRRRFLRLVAAGAAGSALTGLLAACGGSGAAPTATTAATGGVAADPAKLFDAAKKEGAVSWYTGYYAQEVVDAVGKAFTEKYPGVKVEAVRNASQVVWQKLQQEQQAGLKVADVLSSTDPSHFLQLKDEKKLVAYRPSGIDALLPSIRSVDADNLYMIGSIGIVLPSYNTKKVTADQAPKRWKDFLDPKWDKQISIGHPAASGFVGQWVMSMETEFGWTYMEQLNALHPKIGRSINDTVTDLVSGERQIAAGPLGQMLANKSRGNPVDVLFPEDGAIIIPSPSGVLKDAPHPNAAKLFVEFMTTKEYSDVLAKFSEVPIRSDVPFAGIPPLDTLKFQQRTPQEIRDRLPGVIDHFQKTFGI